ncbi:extracellular solute-binding protein, partial [Actinoplanes sp. NPDC051633]|uniref:extracellular solute-binding protein n=1 Tax=Actinoplanes sp. NPDC051633 TaxID=3155670 RepID=UPI00343A7830
MLKKLKLGASALTLGLLAACGGTGAGGTVGVIEYWLWDSGQQPGYQKCADEFAKANPGLSVRISQYGWDSYWSKLTAGFIADSAPDVFTDHLSKFAQFVDLDVLRPLDELGPTADIQDGDYQEGLAELWKGQDGKRYGAPKDWDTIALFYSKDQLKAAGVDESELQDLAWNPQDGGTFEKLVAHMTVDATGKRGDDPGFDKNNVKTYGFASDGAGGGGWGQTQWSSFTGSAGWQATDKNPWGSKFNLDQPAFQ